MTFLPGSRTWLGFAPFFVALALVATLMLFPFTGIGPASNTFALCALASIVLGLLVGVTALLLDKTTRVWRRVFIGVLYFPTAVLSLLIAGF